MRAHRTLSVLAACLITLNAQALTPAEQKDILSKIESGQLQAAMIELKNTLRQSPKDRDARHLLAKVYFEKFDLASAEKELERAISLDLDKSAWMPLQAKILLKKREYDKILNLFTEKAIDEKDITLAWVGDVNLIKAQAMIAQGNTKQAQALIETIMVHHPENSDAWLSMAYAQILENSLEEAQATLTQMASRKSHKLNNKEDAQAQVLWASLYRLKEDLDSARIAYLDAINLDKDNVQARLGLTEVYLLLKDEANFIKQSNLLFQQAPNNSSAVYYHALSLFAQNKLGDVVPLLEKLVAHKPKQTSAKLLLGYSYYRQERFEMAARVLEEYIEMMPNHLGAKAVLASVMLKLNEPEKSIALLEPIVAQKPHYEWLSTLGYSYVLSGNLDKGIEHLERASALMPQDPAIKLELAASLIADQQTSKATKVLDELVATQEYVQADLLRMYVALRAGDTGTALKLANDLMEKDKDNPIFLNSLGLALQANDQIKEAEVAFKKAVDKAPGFLTAITNLSKIYMIEKKYDKAEATLEEAVKLKPESIEVLTLKSQLAELTGQPKLAYKWLQTAQFRNPETFAPVAAIVSYHLRNNDLDKAYEQAKEGLLKFPKNQQAKHLLGQIALQTNHYQEALRLFEDLYQSNPESIPVLQGLARSQMANNQAAKAQDILQTILKKEQSNIQALLMSADIALAQKHYDQVQLFAKRVMDAHPNKGIGYKLSADAALGQGDINHAVKLYQLAYSKQPSFLYLRSLFRSLKYAGELEKGWSLAENYLQQFEHDHQARQYLATEYLMDKNTSKAKEHYGKVVEHNKEDYVSLNNLAHIYLQESDLDKAEKLAAKAYELAPNIPEIADTYAWVLIQRKDAGKALHILSDAIKRQPDSAQLRYHRAVGLYEIGDTAQAKLELEKVLSSDQSFPDKESAKTLLKQIQRQG